MKKKEIIEKLIEDYKKLDSNFNEFTKLTGATYESPLLDSVWRAFDNYTTAVEKLVGDEHQWISWFIYDNRFGADGKIVTVDGEERKITNIKQIIKLIKQK